MKIAVLETGQVPDNLTDKHGSYFGMFRGMLNAADPNLDIHSVKVIDGIFPDSPGDYQGYVITGSAYGVYDNESWIPELFSFIQATAEQNIPQAGICFGHQAMSEALGGKVVKSDKGWGCGVHTYEVIEKQGWMDPALPRTAITVMHQDQVVEPPEGAVVLAGSHFCPNGALSYAQGPAISVQYHPEFQASYAHDLIEMRRGDRIPESIADIGISSLSTASHHSEVGQWITRFLQMHQN